MNRRHSFLGFAAAAVVAGAFLMTAACNDDENPDSPGGSGGNAGSGTGGRSGTGGAGGSGGTGGTQGGGTGGTQGAGGGGQGMGGSAQGSGGAGGGVAGSAGNAGSAGGLPVPGVVVAAGQANVAQMVTDGKSLFWVTTGTEAAGFSDGKVLSCPVDGCPEAGPTVLAENQKKPEFISLSDENYNFKAGEEANKYVFWTTSLGGEVLRCEKVGCGGGPTVLAKNQNGPAGVRASLSLPKANANAELVVLWANIGSGEILQCPDDGCGDAPPTKIASGRASPKAFLTGNSFMYWLEEGAGEAAGMLYRYKKDQATPESPVAQADPAITATRFELAGGQLFAVDRGTLANGYADGQIRWANPVGDLKDIFVQGQKNLFAIVGDGNGLFWNADGKLLSCAWGSTCAVEPRIVAEGVGASELAIDPTFVYFFVGDAIRKVPRVDPPAAAAPVHQPSD